MKASGEAAIVNRQGLHARPSQLLVQTANRFQSQVTIRNGSIAANGKSILEVMTLAAPLGTKLSFEAEGPDAQAQVEALLEVVRRGFDEM